MGCNGYSDIIINILQAQVHNVNSFKIVIIRSKCLDTQSLPCYWFQAQSLLKLLSDVSLLTSTVQDDSYTMFLLWLY